jgi:hypothetical protein
MGKGNRPNGTGNFHVHLPGFAAGDMRDGHFPEKRDIRTLTSIIAAG